MTWIAATGHIDDFNKWSSENLAYDGYTGTKAVSNLIYHNTWSVYLILTIGSMDCSAIRYWVDATFSPILIRVKVYWDGAWHQVQYSGFTKGAWNEVSLDGIHSVTKMNLDFYNGDGAGYAYINEVQFWSPEIPTVTAQAVFDIEEITATGNGNITITRGINCTKRGVCWNTTGNPTVADNKSEETGSFGTGAFSRPMTGLTRGQKYYVKAYAYNPVGYGYSSQVEFVTKPAITTQNPSDITRADPSKVTANGLIEFGGSENITERGFKYGLTEADTWYVKEEGTFGEGSFSLQITDLDPDITYYVRCYCIGTWGTIFGEYVEFKTTVPFWSKKTEIKAEATASDEDINKVGGIRTLPINNHLIQTMSIAQSIANAYLAEYKDQKIMMVVDRSIPLPYERGDTIWQSDLIIPYKPAAEAEIGYKPAAEAEHYYKSIGRYLMIRKINLRFSAGNFVGTIELEG